MRLRVIYLSSVLLVCATFLMCRPLPDLNQYVAVPSTIENPTDSAKIALGKELFFDTRLSLDNTISCAVCHKPGFAFTDGLKTSTGINDQKTDRNSPSILNSGFLKTVMFDAHLKTLELQAIVPIQEPVEMGHNMKLLIPQLRAIPEYQEAAKRIFNRDFDAYVLSRSIAAFERSLISMSAPFDHYLKGNEKALNANERAGWKIFSEKLYCTNCHAPPHFTNHEARNNGLYKDYGADKGRFRIHLDSADIGKFKVPSLRNIEVTDPYMHDGSMETLEEVIAHYASGGQGHYLQDETIIPFELSVKEQKQLIAFLKSLTDLSFLENL